MAWLGVLAMCSRSSCMIAPTPSVAAVGAVCTRFIAALFSAAPSMMVLADLNDAPPAEVPGHEAVAHDLFKKHGQGWCEHEEAVAISRRAGAMLEGKGNNLRTNVGDRSGEVSRCK